MKKENSRLKTAVLAAISVIIVLSMVLIFLSSRKETQTMNLTSYYKDVKEASSPEVEETDQIGNQTGNQTSAREEMPMVINEPAKIYVDPETLVKKMCPEQVLLGLRSCHRTDGNLNITIKNAGYTNLTMIFYLFSEDQEVGYFYSDEPFMTKDEKTYTLDLDVLQETYGNIFKIEATPILIQGMESLACTNKKLPVIVSGCG